MEECNLSKMKWTKMGSQKMSIWTTVCRGLTKIFNSLILKQEVLRKRR
jgi:hypothetical protein